MGVPSRNTSSLPPRPSAETHPDSWDELGLNPTQDVWEGDEPTHSSLLDKDGHPIPYQSRKLGYIGFWQLTEKT